MGYLAGWGSFYHSVLNPGPGQIYESLANLLVAETRLTFADLAGLTATQVRDLALAEGFAYYFTGLEGLTEQIWAVQVQSDPGFSGNLEQQWEAAYGAYEGLKLDGPATTFGDPEGTETHDNVFGFLLDEDDYLVVELGSDYVGNYFNIEQYARTSQSHVYRYIDISSPWSYAYVYEYAEVTGKAEIQEAFSLDNLGPGADVATDWWDIF